MYEKYWNIAGEVIVMFFLWPMTSKFTAPQKGYLLFAAENVVHQGYCSCRDVQYVTEDMPGKMFSVCSKVGELYDAISERQEINSEFTLEARMLCSQVCLVELWGVFPCCIVESFTLV